MDVTNPESEVIDTEVEAPQEAEETLFDHEDSESEEDYSDDTDEADEESAEQEDDSEEIEHEGAKYKIPKALKDSFLRQQDYTRKTQEVAEHRKAVEAQREAHQQQVTFQREFFADCAEAYMLDKQIQEYRKLDLNALYATDPDQARQLDWRMRQLETQRDNVIATVSQKNEQQALQKQQATARRLQEGQAFLEREIKGWSSGNELDQALKSYAAKFDATDIGPAIVGNPKLALILHKAFQFDQLMAKQAAKPKPPTQEKPITRVNGSKGKATKHPSQMNDEEFAKWRKWHQSRRSA